MTRAVSEGFHVSILLIAIQAPSPPSQSEGIRSCIDIRNGVCCTLATAGLFCAPAVVIIPNKIILVKNFLICLFIYVHELRAEPRERLAELSERPA
jgi:hypothetical protein